MRTMGIPGIRTYVNKNVNGTKANSFSDPAGISLSLNSTFASGNNDTSVGTPISQVNPQDRQPSNRTSILPSLFIDQTE